MGHHDKFFDKREQFEQVRRQHGGRGRRGPSPWGEFADWGLGGGGRGGRGGRPGPPPWLTGIFGAGFGPGASPSGDERRGPRVRRGDVRSAILDVVRVATETAEPVNGYQVIQQIADRSGGAWRPSPGSVYPTIQLLQDEGLIETDGEGKRNSLTLTTDGAGYVADHADELAAVWAPFEAEQQRDQRAGGMGDVRAEIGQVMGAVWQIVTSGSEGQQRAAIGVLTDTRRRLYGILADGDERVPDTDENGDPDDLGDGTSDSGQPSISS